MDGGFTVGQIDVCEDSLAQFLQGLDSDVAKRGAGELGEETFDEVEP